MAAGPRPLPSTSFEEALWAAGERFVAGVDEVGRGPLAGPVYAAAVILDATARPGWLSEVRDSKVMTAPERERLSDVIRREAPAYAIGWATVPEIDAWGITIANRMAMVRALQGLTWAPQHVLIDGPARLPNYRAPQQAIVDGDALCCTIAAASIVAKVARDEVMCRLDEVYPAYGFASHKGYATKEHLEQLERHGPCLHHRRSWLAVQRRGAMALSGVLEEQAREPEGIPAFLRASGDGETPGRSPHPNPLTEGDGTRATGGVVDGRGVGPHPNPLPEGEGTNRRAYRASR